MGERAEEETAGEVRRNASQVLTVACELLRRGELLSLQHLLTKSLSVLSRDGSSSLFHSICAESLSTFRREDGNDPKKTAVYSSGPPSDASSTPPSEDPPEEDEHVEETSYAWRQVPKSASPPPRRRADWVEECYGYAFVAWGVCATWHLRYFALKHGVLCYRLPNSKLSTLFRLHEIVKVDVKASLPPDIAPPPERSRHYLVSVHCRSQRTFLFAFHTAAEKKQWAESLLLSAKNIEEIQDPGSDPIPSLLHHHYASTARSVSADERTPTKRSEIVSSEACAEVLKISTPWKQSLRS
ncbi:hypothetical protein DIPPA_70207 [Diplonema papillatum]|nr:hypothetical protein DIPPA_70207 [Diplonema papillatum]